MTQVSVLGVRHHGPGSARAVGAACNALEPDTVLIEGPKELEPLVSLLADPAAQPPLAGLVFAPAEPTRNAFYPFAAFSPEYVAIRAALARGAAVGFIDLPAANMLAWDEDADTDGVATRSDPIARLSEAAGFSDPERWWEDVLEHRHPGPEIFSAVAGAMASLREDQVDSRLTLVREAAMRKRIRAEIKAGAERLVVVCGAWHAPALDPDTFPSASSDNKLLTGLDRVKVEATWVPWTSRRLALASGYGAGIGSPAWYHHLFTRTSEEVIPSWMTRAARLLRDRGFDASPASALEASRLADALAAVRGRPLAGVGELDDAAVAVLCHGSELRLATVADDLYVGADMGSVPDAAPMVPLGRDLEATRKRLRLEKSAEERLVELDLRTPSHLGRSQLFHRLALLGIHWARQAAVAGRTLGTFKEAWTLEWGPELEIAVVEAAAFGPTIDTAAAAALTTQADTARLADLIGMIEHATLADLPDSVDVALDRLRRRVATLDDIGTLMDAVEPLARVARYGDVRGRSEDHASPVLTAMVTRISIGLAAACSSLDDDAARVMHARIAAVHRGLALHRGSGTTDEHVDARWLRALSSVAAMGTAHGLIVGYATRLLLDRGEIPRQEAGNAVSRALSTGADPERGAAWLEGFLKGDAALILHDHDLLATIDEWLSGVAVETFDDLVPLLRRSFSRFSAAERRMIGTAVKSIDAEADEPSGAGREIDARRADLVVAKVMALLGDAGE